MSEISGVTNIDNKNTYNINPAKIDAAENNDFSSYLGQAKSLDEIFEQAADQYNVPVELLKAVGKAESDFNPEAVSRCGARGVMQLMPATAKELGVSDAFDAEQNIIGGAKYLSTLLKKYDGDPRLALAAYNAGSGNVSKYGGIPPFTETQNYVKKVMNFMGGDIEIASATDTKGSSAINRTVAAAAPVQRNLAFLLTNETGSTSDGLQDLETLFSYDDYVNFLEIFLNSDKEQDQEGNPESNKEGKNSGYSANEINYNVPVMNLLKDQKLF